jgi:uncharacterized OsmC-like protein
MPRNVYIDSGQSNFAQNISIGPHRLQVDEPSDLGGKDRGPTPYELLMAALGACTCITVRMYAERKQWPLEGVHVKLSYARAHAEDSARCDTEVRMIDQVEMEISFVGYLSEDQRQRLMAIANMCPVHRTLSSQIQIRERLAINPQPPA